MSNLTYEILFLFLVLFCLFFVKYTEFQKGRINMCNELGMNYNYKNNCVDPNPFYEEEENEDENYILNIKDLRGKNATILQFN